MLIRIFAGCVPLFGSIGRHPDMIRCESGAAHDFGVGLYQWRAVFARYQTIARCTSEAILFTWVYHAPETRRRRVHPALSFLLCGEQRFFGLERIAVRIRGARGHADAVHLVD